jgi:hypothetical protein
MNELRKAAEQALEALQDTCDHLPARSGVEREVDEAITALQVALAQPEQEPVDWEVVAADQAMTIAMMKLEKRDSSSWVGLTDADKEVLLANLYESVEGLITAIEAKLKDKNGW